MFTHVVLFKLKNNSKENIKKMADLLRSMDGKIPMLRGLTVGEDVLFTERSYDLCLITTFDSQEALDEYQVHEYHVETVLKNLRPELESSKACDFFS